MENMERCFSMKEKSRLKNVHESLPSWCCTELGLSLVYVKPGQKDQSREVSARSEGLLSQRQGEPGRGGLQ